MAHTVHSVRIDTASIHYRDLNAHLRQAVARGKMRVDLHNVCDQRYVGTNLKRAIKINFGYDAGAVLNQPFTKLVPLSSRPYGRLRAY
jgi:hypothetical protein